MASTSAFPSRNTYAPASKLADRAALNNNPLPFGSSSLARRSDQQNQPYSQPVPPPHGSGRQQQQQQQQQQQHQPQQPQHEKEPNVLNELSEEQREEIDEAFSLFDLDRDRHLDYHELRVALRALGFQPPKPELVHLLTTHGVPRPQPSTGPSRHPQPQSPHPSQLLVPQSAFQQLAARKILERDPREEIDRAFDLFDAEGKGWIVLEDLKRVARELGETGLEEEELRAMIEEFDLEGSGGIGREAFAGICLQ